VLDCALRNGRRRGKLQLWRDLGPPGGLRRPAASQAARPLRLRLWCRGWRTEALAQALPPAAAAMGRWD
jgi:hypothetical protein